MIKRFDDFQNYDTFSHKIGLVGESHDLTDLYGDDCELMISIKPNAYSTHQVFNRLAGSAFIPESVQSKFRAQKLATPITSIEPDSKIRTFPTFRHLNVTPMQKGSLYFSKPKFNEQVQIVSHKGNLIGARQIVGGKPVHLNLDRFPHTVKLAKIAENLHQTLGEDLIRFRAGITTKGPVILTMENFKLDRPDLVNLYFAVHESYIGKLPIWYKHKIQTGLVNTYLNEYINREEVSKLCPYLL
jgi:hypothetical protein